jgi:hypothetical protein
MVFGYEGANVSIKDADKNFRIYSFLEIIDSAITLFRRNIEMYETHGEV